MSQEAVVNTVLPPPVIPLHKLRQPPPIPPARPPKVSKATIPEGKKKERRLGIAGLEPGDPLSIFHLVKLGLKNAVAIIPRMVIKYWWIILLVFVGWFLLSTFNVYQLSSKYPFLRPVLLLMEKLVLLLVFLTGAYNNFVAKAIYAAIIIRVGLPLYGRIRREGLPKVINDFSGLIPGFKESWQQAESLAPSLLIGFMGLGAFLSNYLTRNNRVDKIAVSLALAMALAKALSDGPKSLPFMVSRVVLKDFFFLMARPSPVRNYHIYVAVSAVSLGLLCCLPFSVLSKMLSDNIGYITGALAMAAAGGLFYLKKTPLKS